MHEQIPPTLSFILQELYPLERPQSARATRLKLRSHVARWVQFGDNIPANQITRQMMLQFRKRSCDAGFSPSTVNSWVRSISDLARIAGHDIDTTRLKLTERSTPLTTPSPDQLAMCWRATTRTQWPAVRRLNCRPVWCSIGSGLWWRAVLLFAFSTGLRRADLFGLKWSELSDNRIATRNRKTGKHQYLPLPAPLQSWLPLLRRLGTETLFGVNDRVSQIAREFNRLGRAAGMDGLGCQAMRRASARAYEIAHPGAGAILLNHAGTVTTTNYIDREDILREASRKLIYPPGFLDAPTLERQLLLF